MIQKHRISPLILKITRQFHEFSRLKDDEIHGQAPIISFEGTHQSDLSIALSMNFIYGYSCGATIYGM